MDSWNKEQTAKMSASEKKIFKDYYGKEAAESDLRTLTEAAGIKKDPKRLKMAVACGKMMKEKLEAVV